MGSKLPPPPFLRHHLLLLLLPRRPLFPFPWLPPSSCFSSAPCPAVAASTPPHVRAPSGPAQHTAAALRPAAKPSRSSSHPEKPIRLLDSTPDTRSPAEASRGASSRMASPATPRATARFVMRLVPEGDAQRVEDYLREMEAAAEHPRNVEEALGLVIGCFCREGRLPAAFRVFKAACLEGRWPQISACNALLGALVAEGHSDLESVVFVYKEMVKGGVVPDVETVNCLVEALFQASCVAAAVDQFRRMKNRGCLPNSRTFEVVIRNLCVNGCVDEAVEVFDEMFECGCKPDVNLFSSITPLFCAFERFAEAMKLFQLMRVVGVVPDSSVYGAIICCLCEKGELDHAAHLLEEMSERGLPPEASVYVSVVNGFCKMGNFGEASIFLDKNGVFEVEPYNTLLEDHCREGRFLHASNLLKKMLENDVSDKFSWNILIRALCESRNIRKAFEVLGRMVVSGYLPDEVTFSAVITGHCLVGAYENALACFQHVRANCWSLDCESYTNFIHCLSNVRRIQEATEIFYYMSGKGHSLPTSSLNFFISHICLNGFVNEAIKLRSISFCNGLPSSSVMFNTIILRLLELNKAEHVRVLLSQMLVEDCTPDVETYCLLIRGLCTTSMTQDAALLFDQMSCSGLIPNFESVDILLSCLAENSQVYKVAQNLEKLIDRGLLLSSMTYNKIICALLREGCKDEAGKFLDQMLEKGWVPDGETHGLLVGNACEKGEYMSFETLKVNINDSVTNILAEGLSNASEFMIEE